MSEVLKLILDANNTCKSAFKCSNDSAENLNNKDTAFLIINKKLSCAIKILRNSQENIESTNPAYNTESAKCEHSYKRVPNTFMFEKSVCEKCGDVEIV